MEVVAGNDAVVCGCVASCGSVTGCAHAPWTRVRQVTGGPRIDKLSGIMVEARWSAADSVMRMMTNKPRPDRDTEVATTLKRGRDGARMGHAMPEDDKKMDLDYAKSYVVE